MNFQINPPKRPLIRYHGGKWRLGKWIISHFARHKVYTEVFGGGASVLLQKDRAYAEVYNDLDLELVNLFRVVRTQGDALKQALELTPYSREEFNLSYLPSADALELARRTIVRSCMGFGSNAHSQLTGFRSNSSRSFTTPAHDWRNYPANLVAIIERLRGVCLENRDAVKVLLTHDSEETLHYVDPPYVAETRNKGDDYRFEMTREDHANLALTLHSLKGKVCLSGYDCELYQQLYADWRVVKRRSFADGARERTECLWMNYSPEEMLLL